jgi:fatty-acyl-CoA synthase
MAAALGVKFGLWHWRFGLGTLIVEWGPCLLGAAVVLALAALIAALVRRPRRGVWLALVALIVPAIGLGYLYQVRGRSATIPPIHDVATQVEDPPSFSPGLMAKRAAVGANPVHPLTATLSSIEAYQSPRFAEQASRTVGELGREAYPNLRPLAVAATPERLFEVLAKEARERGWTIVTNDPPSGRFEATAETFWFGFKDDVAVRARSAPSAGQLIVDARSTSRVGLGDLGANAARLTDYLADVDQELKAAR